MKRNSIRKFLRPYSIYNRRRTTINHAFASAIASIEEYDEKRVSEALKFLVQDPDSNLVCAYCDESPAETWDHVFALVQDNQYSGYGHVIGNLLPCCSRCNSKKGNKSWSQFISELYGENERKNLKLNKIKKYLDHYLPPGPTLNEIKKICPEEMIQYDEIRNRILSFMKQADDIARNIRDKVRQMN